jgi:hypothetical protein
MSCLLGGGFLFNGPSAVETLQTEQKANTVEQRKNPVLQVTITTFPDDHPQDLSSLPMNKQIAVILTINDHGLF